MTISISDKTPDPKFNMKLSE